MDGVHSARPATRRGAPPRGQRLTREVVIDRATQLIAANGLAAFSLRRLAEHLEVRPNALYNHVGNREELLQAVADRFVGELRIPAHEQPWPEWVRLVAIELRAQLTQHPGLTELVLARAGTTTAGPGVLAGFLDRLEAAGVDRAVAHVGWHAVLTVVVGSLSQGRATGRSAEPTFHTVLDLTISGLLAQAGQPPSAQASALLAEHALAQR